MVAVQDSNLIGNKIDCPKCKYRFVVERPEDEEDDSSGTPAPTKNVKKSNGVQAGKPAARLTAFEPVRKKPRLGMWEGKAELRPGWDSPETDAEIEAMFEVLKESRDR